MPVGRIMASGHAQCLGTVGFVAARWGLLDRLAGALTLGDAYGETLAATVEVSRRAKTRAGAAYSHQHRIVLNRALLYPGRETDRDSVFLHECAHLLANLHRGRNCGHGPAWRSAMRLLGEPPEACHDIEYLSRRAHAVVTWVCVNCAGEYHFVRRPRRKIDRCYCRRCGPGTGRLKVRTDQAKTPSIAAADAAGENS